MCDGRMGKRARLVLVFKLKIIIYIHVLIYEALVSWSVFWKLEAFEDAGISKL